MGRDPLLVRRLIRDIINSTQDIVNSSYQFLFTDSKRFKKHKEENNKYGFDKERRISNEIAS